MDNYHLPRKEDTDSSEASICNANIIPMKHRWPEGVTLGQVSPVAQKLVLDLFLPPLRAIQGFPRGTLECTKTTPL